ncbi:MAG: O-antigen ligase family protein [Rhodospirillaceae bacterium]
MLAATLSKPGLARTAAILLGVAVPSIAWGRGLVNTFAAVGLALVLACLWGDRRRAVLPPLSSQPLAVGLCVLAVAWLPSALLSIAPGHSLATWALVVLLLGGGVAVHHFLAADVARQNVVLKTVVTTAAIAAVYAALRYSLPPALQPGLHTGHMALVFKAASNLFALLIPVLLWAGWVLRGRWLWASGLAVAGSLLMIAGSDSRAALAGVLAGALAAAFAVILRRRWWWILVPVAALMAGAFWYLFQRMAGADLGHLEVFAPAWLIDVHRQHIWAFALAGFTDHPLVGVGMGAAKMLPGAMDMIPGVGGMYLPAHPHNWLVEVLSETGLIGTLPLVVVVMGLTVAALRRWLFDGDIAALALFTLVIMFFAAGLFNFSLWRAYWLIGLIVPVALLTAALRTAYGASGTRLR